MALSNVKLGVPQRTFAESLAAETGKPVTVWAVNTGCSGSSSRAYRYTTTADANTQCEASATCHKLLTVYPLRAPRKNVRRIRRVSIALAAATVFSLACVAGPQTLDLTTVCGSCHTDSECESCERAYRRTQ